jgi:hypothetical protein
MYLKAMAYLHKYINLSIVSLSTSLCFSFFKKKKENAEFVFNMQFLVIPSSLLAGICIKNSMYLGSHKLALWNQK